MKSLVCAVLVLITVKASAQKAIVSATAEMTVSGYEGGGAIFYESKRVWRIGAFYQTSKMLRRKESATENSFGGLTTCVPFAKSEKVNFHGVIRTGLVNKKFLVVTPGFETTVRLSNNFSIGAGMSIRKAYPSASIKFNVIL